MEAVKFVRKPKNWYNVC